MEDCAVFDNIKFRPFIFLLAKREKLVHFYGKIKMNFLNSSEYRHFLNYIKNVPMLLKSLLYVKM